MDALFEFLFGGMFDRMFGWLFSGHLRQQVKELQQHNQAQQTGEPFVCDLPADLRMLQQDRSGRGRGKWTRGVLHVQATTLVWDPRPGNQVQSWDLTAATVTKTTTIVTSRSKYLNTERLTMRVAEHAIELAIRQPFLPFLRVGLEQAAIRTGPAALGTSQRMRP